MDRWMPLEKEWKKERKRKRKILINNKNNSNNNNNRTLMINSVNFMIMFKALS